MLKDVIDFIVARTGYDRTTALREINYAWEELWNTDDLPDSLFEISLVPSSTTGLLSLPYYVGQIRAVKEHDSHARITLETPRPYYHDGRYDLSPYTWRILGSSPLRTSITNASPLTLTIAEPETEEFTVTLEGPTDNAARSAEVATFAIGETSKVTTKCFTDITSATKDMITKANVNLSGANSEDYGYIPNDDFEARNILAQITERCGTICTSCACYDVLYKRKVPLLLNEGASVPFQQVLMTKTLEWITLPKDGGEVKADIFGQKARSLLEANVNSNTGVEKRLDLPINPFVTRYYGHL